MFVSLWIQMRWRGWDLSQSITHCLLFSDDACVLILNLLDRGGKLDGGSCALSRLCNHFLYKPVHYRVYYIIYTQAHCPLFSIFLLLNSLNSLLIAMAMLAANKVESKQELITGDKSSSKVCSQVSIEVSRTVNRDESKTKLL